MTRRNKKGAAGSPCFMPREMLNLRVVPHGSLTELLQSLYKVRIALLKY